MNNTKLTAERGEEVELDCRFDACNVTHCTGFPQDIPVIWSKQDSDGRWTILQVGAASPAALSDRFRFTEEFALLRIGDVRTEDQGLYKCEVATGNLAVQQYLRVEVTPKDWTYNDYYDGLSNLFNVEYEDPDQAAEPTPAIRTEILEVSPPATDYMEIARKAGEFALGTIRHLAVIAKFAYDMSADFIGPAVPVPKLPGIAVPVPNPVPI